jgi:hypothetical protein
MPKSFYTGMAELLGVAERSVRRCVYTHSITLSDICLREGVTRARTRDRFEQQTADFPRESAPEVRSR